MKALLKNVNLLFLRRCSVQLADIHQEFHPYLKAIGDIAISNYDPWANQVDEIDIEEAKEDGNGETSIFFKLDMDIQKLNDLFTLKNVTEIKRFLSSNEHLIYPLFKAHNYIEDIFYPNFKPILEVFGDPEETYEGLFIIIRTSLPPEQSVDLLENFQEKWGSEWNPEVIKLIGIDIEGNL